MFSDGALAFQENAMGEPIPLAVIHSAVLDFLRGRADLVLQGAQAVNAYVDEPRMTQDVEILAVDAERVAEEIRGALNHQFHISVRVREVRDGEGFRVYQLQASGNRHLVDVRRVEQLPPSQSMSEILVLTPIELIASKVVSYHNRQGKPKSFTDLRDLALLLLTFPDLKAAAGPVRERLLQISPDDGEILAAWDDLSSRDFQPDED